MAIDFKTSPYIVLGINGYHPFTPDAGILAGGYQSPIYPHPITMEQPNPTKDIIDLQSSQIPSAAIYTMKINPDFYQGLGRFNPGTNYRNPGHLLGLFDTFNRMGYGLAILKNTLEGSQEDATEIINPITGTIPFLKADSSVPIEFVLDDIYTLGFSEKPPLYILGFVNGDGDLILDPRTTFVAFDFDGNYSPQSIGTTDVTNGFQTIFANKVSESYFNMPTAFQNIFQELQVFAQNNLNGEHEVELTNDNLGKKDLTVDDVPRLPLQASFDNLTGDLNSHLTDDGFIDHTSGRKIFYTSFTTLTKDNALRMLTGDVEFSIGDSIPDGGPKLLQHNTITELNSVINLVPNTWNNIWTK